MSRPLRIEYPNAVYHVMNRGQGKRTIFHGEAYSDAFFTCLAEAHRQFGLEVLAYCLMNNHYHLLVRTPRANLSRCMRHVNSIYTQRYNKLRKTDGPLFRGRYKAILVEEDSYLLPVSRYIHRNPIETKTPMVARLEDYSLSSYPATINKAPVPAWLNRAFVLSVLSSRQHFRAYKAYVAEGNHEELSEFYNPKKQASILGSDEFKNTAKKRCLASDEDVFGETLLDIKPMSLVVGVVAEYYHIPEKDVLQACPIRSVKNLPRQMAMYLCQQHSGATLKQIAEFFSVGSYFTVSKAISRLRYEMELDTTLRRAVVRVAKSIVQ